MNGNSQKHSKVFLPSIFYREKRSNNLTIKDNLLCTPLPTPKTTCGIGGGIQLRAVANSGLRRSDTSAAADPAEIKKEEYENAAQSVLL